MTASRRTLKTRPDWKLETAESVSSMYQAAVITKPSVSTCARHLSATYVTCCSGTDVLEILEVGADLDQLGYWPSVL